MMSNDALQPTPWRRVAGPGFPRSLRSLGAAERERSAHFWRGREELS